MGTLWTPGGERETSPQGEVPSDEAHASAEETAAAREQLEQVRAELAATPVRDIVANHAIGLWQLAVLHLGLDDEEAEPDLPEAKLAIDALTAMVEGVADRLGDHRDALESALTNLRLAYVQVSQEAGSPGAPDAG